MSKGRQLWEKYEQKLDTYTPSTGNFGRDAWMQDSKRLKTPTVKTPETTVETPANSGERKITVSPGGTFLGGFSFTAPRQKTAQELADEAKQQQAYLAEYERLSTLDLEALEKEVDEAKQAAKGSHGMYDIKAFGGGDLPTQQDSKYTALQTDLNKARSIQYENKGREALDKLTEEQTAAVEALAKIESVAASAQSDADKKAAARELLAASGFSEEDISQLVNYQRHIPQREKNAERYAKVQEMARNEADKSPVFGTLLSVPANLLSGVGAAYTAVEKLRDPDTPSDYHSIAMLPYAYASGVRGEVTKNLQYDHGDNAAFLYGVGTSILDSAATAALTALGVPAAAASATLGGAAATDAMVTAKERGLDDTHAIISGVAAGVFETFFEKYSLENLISMKLPTGTMKQRLAGLLKNTATQAGVEGSEEMFTDLANLMVDKIANGDMADVNQRIAVYMAGGMSYQDAQQKVANETVKNIAVDFAAGALAGGIMGGGNMAVQTAAHNRYQDAVKQVRERAGITGSFQTSEDGRTSYNDKEAQIRSVVKDGKVELASGETVDPRDVRFKDQQTADLYEGAISSAENAGAAQVFVDSYTGGDVSQYLLGMQQAYAAGRSGIAQEDMTPGTFADDLSRAQFRAAYAQGQAATEAEFPVMRDMGLGESGSAAWAEVQRTSRTQSKGKLQAGFTVMYQAGLRREAASGVKSAAASALPQSVQTAAYKAGLSDAAASLAREKAGLSFVSSAGSESGLADSEYAQRLAQEKAGTAALLNTMGKELGLRVEIVPTVRGGSANGQYVASRNLIQIAADADNAIDFVAAHEVTHRMQELAPEEYRAYRDHAMRYRAQESGEEGAAAYVERYRAMAEEAGVKLTQEEAMDEIAADFTRDMMANGKLFENFAKENRPAAKRMLDALKAFIEKIKALFRGKEARDAAAQSAYGKDMAELEACAALWQKAYDAAAKQAQNAKTAAREGDGEGRYQIRREFMREIDEWAKDGRPDGETFILGSTGPVLQGLGAIENDIFMESTKINKILVDHPEMTLEEIKRVPQILEDPVMVLKSKTRANSIVVFGTYRAQNGNPILAAIDLLPMKNRIFISGMQKVSSTYTKTGSRTQTAEEVGAAFLNGSEVLFLDKKRATPVLRRMGIYTPIGLLRSGYIGSIALNEARVNIQGVPFAEVVDSGMQAKFSLKKPVEETKNLLALHNLTEKNLLDAVKLGGLPMPSIAVVKGDAGHSEYGPISFVFSKDTIDPQLFRSNKVYGYDAWTPTAPAIEFKANGKVEKRLHDLYYRMYNEKGRNFVDPLYSVANTLEDELNRRGGVDKIISSMRDDPRVMNIYLEDTGRGAVKNVMRRNVSRMDENQQEMSEFLIRELGDGVVNDFRPKGNESPLAARKLWYKDYGEALNAALQKYYEKQGLSANDAADVVNAETVAAKTRYLLDAKKYLAGNVETVTEEVDRTATDKAIRDKTDKGEYDRWLDDLFDGAVEKRGIRNNKDMFTPQGNRRSFDALHYEVNLENIVKAMKADTQKGGGILFGGQAIWGVTAKDYRSIADIKADSNRLVHLSEEEYSKIRENYSNRLDDLILEIKDPNARNEFLAMDDAATAIIDTLRTKHTVSAIDKELRTYSMLRIKPDTAEKVLQLAHDISNMPTGYFEAKPQRAVGFDEVLAAVIPDDTSAEVRAALAQAGVKTIAYKSGDEQSRTDAVNSVEGARFQLKAKDSTGRQLSEQQQAYFKDSKVRDAEGNLRPMYQGGTGSFTVFDRKKSKSSNLYGRGFYFTDSKTHAGQYGDVREFYLNITNPVSTTETTITRAQMRRFLAAVAENEDDFSFENYGYGATVDSVLRSLYGKSDFLMLNDVSQTAIGDMVAAVELFNEVNGTSYDGLIMDTETVAFRSEQIKNVDNKKPTGDPDIRYQLKSAAELEQEVRELKKERRALENRNKVLTERVAKWRGELRRTETPSVRPGDVKKLGLQFLSDYGSSTDYRAIEGDMTALGKALMADDVSMDTLRPHARAAAEKIIDGVLVQSESGGELLAIRDHLKNVTLRYTDDGSIPDFKAWKKANRRTLKISDKSGLDVDVAYSELTEMFGEGYFPSDIIHPDDQLLRISEVLEDVGRIYENPFDSYRDAAVTELADMLIDGMIGEDVRQSSPTFADRQALELQEAKGRLTQMLIKTREGRDRQVARMQRHYQEQTKAGRERRNATALRAKIARHTADLSRKLLNPTDKQHIPEMLRQSVAALLGSINQESAYSYNENGKLVHNTSGDPTKRTQAAIALKAAYNEIRNSGELVLDPDLLGREGAGLLDQVMAFGNKRIADMNSEELTTVWQAVRAIEHSVSTYNRNLAIERYAGVQEIADALRSGTASRRRVNRGVALDFYDPYSFFYGYGEAGMQIYRTLRNAQDKQNTMLKAIQDTVEKFMDEAVYKSRMERHAFFVGEDGKRLVLTTGQIMNLYNLMRRGEQAVRHMTVGGVVQPAIEKKGKQAAIDRGTENIRLTMDDLKAITGALTEADKRVAEGLQKIASGYLAKQGNEASMTVYGYRKFTERNYWPIKVTKEGTTQNAEKSPELPREIRNIGSAKPLTPNASNALEMLDVFDVFAQNASDMIQYSTLLAPMEDINRIYNYRYRDAEGNLTGKNVKQVLTDVYGEAAPTYWTNLMRDLQNGLNSTGTDTTRLVEKLVGNAKGASVGFNARVVIQQPTAYVRAAAILDPSTMAKGMVGGATEGSGWEKAKRYAPIASIKDTAGFDQSSRYSIAQNIYGGEGGLREKLNDWSGWAAGKADAVTWGAIWNACEWTVVNEGGYERGSDAFYSRVAQVFTDVIDQSQVVDGILQRTQIMRDKGGLAKQATAFMGEPLKTLNMFMRAYDAWRFEQNIPKRSAAMKKMTRTIGAVLVTDIVNALVQSLVDAFRDDDKDKGYWERYLEKLTGFTGDKEKDNLLSVLWGSNLWDNMDPLGRLPYLKDVKSLMQGFTVSRMDADTVGEFISAMQLFIRSAQGEGKKTTLYAAKQLLTTGSKIFGISLANAGRDAWAAARSIAQSSGNVRIMYEMERAIWRLAPDAGNNTRYYKLLYMAMERDKDAYQYIYDDMKKRGYSDKQLQDGIKKIIKDSDVSDTDMKAQLEEIGYSSEEAQGFVDRWAFIDGNDTYNDVTVSAVGKYNKYCANAGIPKDLFFTTWKETNAMTGEDYDGDGESDAYSKMDKQLKYINTLSLTTAQKRALALACGISEKTLGSRAPW